MSIFHRTPPVVLVILDGWGVGRDEPGNAVLAARTPTMDRLWSVYPHATLHCAGGAVGLPAGQMGNSEVGHLNLGAGYVVDQWLTRLDQAIADGEFAANPTFAAVVAHAQSTGGTLHLLGLVGEGGVHGHQRHIEALLRLAGDRGARRVALHAFTDGRDTSPTSGLGAIEALEQTMIALGVGRIASVCGRYDAMDRDHRWERTRGAYDALVHGTGDRAPTAATAIARAYAAGITDEFIPPTIIAGEGEAATTIQPGDAVIFANFRADRARQLTRALVDPDFAGFARGEPVADLHVVTMSRYQVGLPVRVAFASRDVEWPLARCLSEAGIAQFHCAESEKYAHVTFFLNGGREEPFPGEERTLVPSPQVATYDQQPEMSAAGVTSAVVAAIASGGFPFVVVNFANGDMVGHTGVFEAAVRAIETVDSALGEVVSATLAAGGVALVTADHGNAEEMIDRERGRPMTAHTTNPVPVVLVAPDSHPSRRARLRQDARLCAVAPTLLSLLGVPLPPTMAEPGLDQGDDG